MLFRPDDDKTITAVFQRGSWDGAEEGKKSQNMTTWTMSCVENKECNTKQKISATGKLFHVQQKGYVRPRGEAVS